MPRLLPALVLALAAAGPGLAQPLADAAEAAQPGTSPVLTITQDRLLTATQIGKAAEARFEAESRALLAENRRIEAALEAEERILTDRRATMTPDEFRPLADAFDAKAEDIRTARDAKSRALTRARDEERQRILEAAVPVLAQMMQEMGAVALIERSTVLLSFDRIDITDAAIARLDEVLGTGEAPAPPAEDAGIPRGAP